MVEYDILAAEDILQFVGIVQAASCFWGCQRLPNFGRGSNNGMMMQPTTQYKNSSVLIQLSITEFIEKQPHRPAP